MFFYVAICFLLLILQATGYVCIRFQQALPPMPIALRIGIVLLLYAFSLSFLTSILFRNFDMPHWMSRCIFNVGSVWLVFLLYLVLALLVTDLAAKLFPAFRHGFIVALATSAGLLIYGNCKYRNPQINEVKIALPVERPLTIAALSDVHLGVGTGRKALAKYVNIINDQHPDVVFIAGDLVDNNVTPLMRENMEEELNRIKAPMGIYMVLGNHEYISGIHRVDTFLKKTKIKLLRDSIVHLPGGLVLLGRDDKFNKKRMSLSQLMPLAGNTKPVFVLDHQPYEVALADSLGAAVQFYGHTHRGQVWPMTWITDALFEQSHGYRRWKNGHVYVSQGLSLWGPPFRIGSESELVVFHIQPS